VTDFDTDFDLAVIGQIRTFSGHYVYPLSMSVEHIELVDIAHALGNICRFGGHTATFYSVAEHSVAVMRRVEEQGGDWLEMRCALLHDASEAYLGDVCRPLKRHADFKFYRRAEERCERAIAEKFSLRYPMPPVVMAADNDQLRYETEWIRDMMHRTEQPPMIAKVTFLHACETLGLL
jgi:hypothetical protein